MLRFLRRNSRHHFYWLVAGPGGAKWPRLNPISSVHGGGNRVVSLFEPLWLFRLRQRLFSFAGRQRCPRRGESHFGQTDKPLPDTWDRGPDGCRTCSYCGSMHQDDFFRLVIATASAGPNAGDDVPSIDPSDKGYKIYVKQPGVRNAGEGAIKFYTQHLSSLLPSEYAAAVRNSRIRFERSLKTMFKGAKP